MPKWKWVATVFATLLIVLSFGFGYQQPFYSVAITSGGGQSGSVRLVFYGDSYDRLVKAQKLTTSLSDWRLIRGEDSATLVSTGTDEPVLISTKEGSILVGLVMYSQGGEAIIDDGTGNIQKIDLHSPVESIHPLIIGGSESSVRSSGNMPFGLWYWTCTFILIFTVIAAIAMGSACVENERAIVLNYPKKWEIIAFALPLMLACAVTHMAYFPGNCSFDASLQWVEAVNRGSLSEALNLPTTYLMRFFALFSDSPMPLILLQWVMGAFGVACVLLELRRRGVPFIGAFVVVVIVALTPQYPAFFTGLGKDALCGMGILFFSWALLTFYRVDRPSLRHLVALVGWGLFAGLMRSNSMPIILIVMVLALSIRYQCYRNSRLIAVGLLFLSGAFIIPLVLSTLAEKEILKCNQNSKKIFSNIDKLPLGEFANFYIYHLFGAAMSSGIDLPPEDAALFFAIAPRHAWETYDCYMIDTTLSAVSKGMLLNPLEYRRHLKKNQVAMALSVMRFVMKNPEVLVERQMCITRMLWYVGFGQQPFQSTVTLGFDSVDTRFLLLAGESRNMWPNFRQVIGTYLQWTESPGQFWFFWRPALQFSIGCFIVFMYLIRANDQGVMLVALIPLLSVLLLMAVIPFPAYRYAYPSVLMTTLLGSLAFARPVARCNIGSCQ